MRTLIKQDFDLALAKWTSSPAPPAHHRLPHRREGRRPAEHVPGGYLHPVAQPGGHLRAVAAVRLRRAGLPIGLQLIAGAFAEETLLGTALPMSRRRRGIYGGPGWKLEAGSWIGRLRMADVRCYAGSRYPERPFAFAWEGGWLEVVEVRQPVAHAGGVDLRRARRGWPVLSADVGSDQLMPGYIAAASRSNW